MNIERPTKSLDGRDAAGARPAEASLRRPTRLPAEEGAQEHAQHRAGEARVEGELDEEILQGYSDLERAGIQQAFEYAAWLAREEVRTP